MGIDSHSYAAVCAVYMAFELHRVCQLELEPPSKNNPLNAKTRSETFIGIKVPCINLDLKKHSINVGKM
jgi:hypothetical protein